MPNGTLTEEIFKSVFFWNLNLIDIYKMSRSCFLQYRHETQEWVNIFPKPCTKGGLQPHTTNWRETLQGNVQTAAGGTKYKKLGTVLDTIFNDLLLTLHTALQFGCFPEQQQLSWWAPELHQSFQSATGSTCEEILVEDTLGEVGSQQETAIFLRTILIPCMYSEALPHVSS